MARQLLKDVDPICADILNGKYDEILDAIAQCCKARVKTQFRKGQKYILRGTRNVELDGQIATVTKVNQKSISVGVGIETTDQWGTTWSGGEYNVSPTLLAPIGSEEPKPNTLTQVPAPGERSETDGLA